MSHPRVKYPDRDEGLYDRAWESMPVRELLQRLEGPMLTDWNDETQRHNVEAREVEWVERRGRFYDRHGKAVEL